MQTVNIFEQARAGEVVIARFHDMPYGDPFSGTPYGEHLKSKGLGMILGVVASVMTMGAALPMLATAVAATQIMGGVMMAGGVMTGVGAITGNKKLLKIGGVLSLAGGLGNMAANALGAGAEGATGMLAAGSGSTAVSNMAGSMMDSVNGLGLGNLYDPKLVDVAKSAGQVAPTPGTLSPATAEGGAITSPVTAPKLDEVALAGTGGQDPSTINVAGAGENGSLKATLDNINTPNMSTPGTGPGIPPPKETGILDKALGFINKNPEITKIGAGMLEKAVGSSAEDEKVAQMNEYYKANTDLLKTKNDVAQYQAKNMAQQVMMISADDPDVAGKVAAAKAAGQAFTFIPTIGAGVTAPKITPKPFVAGTSATPTPMPATA